MTKCSGFLIIGDPHLTSRVPGYRKDDYPQTILTKIAAALAYARTEHLVPVILGDIFHYPRDNANWLLTELIQVLAGHHVYTIFGNHDCSENSLLPDDSLAILIAAGVLELLEPEHPVPFDLSGEKVYLGGTSWGRALPWQGPAVDDGKYLWVTHHDISFPGYDSGRIKPKPIPGIDLIINGHIHTPSDSVYTEGTIWMNPGNISRISRSDLSRQKKPAALAVRLDDNGEFATEAVPLPHESFDAVFHEAVEETGDDHLESAFVRGLEGLTSLKTQDGSALKDFLEENLPQYPDDVAAEIRQLANEVTGNE